MRKKINIYIYNTVIVIIILWGVINFFKISYFPQKVPKTLISKAKFRITNGIRSSFNVENLKLKKIVELLYKNISSKKNEAVLGIPIRGHNSIVLSMLKYEVLKEGYSPNLIITPVWEKFNEIASEKYPFEGIKFVLIVKSEEESGEIPNFQEAKRNTLLRKFKQQKSKFNLIDKYHFMRKKLNYQEIYIYRKRS